MAWNWYHIFTITFLHQPRYTNATVRRQAIIWTNAGMLLIGPLGTNFSEIIIGIQRFSFKKMHLNMSSARWRPFCLGLNVLMDLLIIPFYNILFVYTWNDFSWLIMCDYTVWIVFYDLIALSENDEIKMINQSTATAIEWYEFHTTSALIFLLILPMFYYCINCNVLTRWQIYHFHN